MEFEQQLSRYFELEKILESKNSTLDESDKKELEKEFKKLSESLYGIFMGARLKLNLTPSINFKDWIHKEQKQLNEINDLIGEVDNSFQSKEIKTIPTKDEYTKIWMQNICDALNKAGLMMPKEKGGGEWMPNKFESVIELIKEHITYDRGIYNYLNEKGLINTGRCPITGKEIKNIACYQIFGRKVFLSEEGKTIAKEIDRKEHIKHFGKEPLSDEKKAYLREEIIQKQGNKLMTRLVISLILIFIIFKACS